MKYYFAYGSNMDPQKISQKDRLRRIPKACSAQLQGYRLCFNKVAKNKPGIGWANIVTTGSNDTVHGILYDVTDDDMARLDGVEKGYKREHIDVQLSDGTTISAITFVAHDDRMQDGLLPTPEYLNHLLAGRDYLPPDYVAVLEKQPVRECK